MQVINFNFRKKLIAHVPMHSKCTGSHIYNKAKENTPQAQTTSHTTSIIQTKVHIGPIGYSILLSRSGTFLYLAQFYFVDWSFGRSDFTVWLTAPSFYTHTLAKTKPDRCSKGNLSFSVLFPNSAIDWKTSKLMELPFYSSYSSARHS